MLFAQVGELADKDKFDKIKSNHIPSSKSAINTLAPEFNALIIIFLLTGPVISTRLSCKSAGMDATFHSLYGKY